MRLTKLTLAILAGASFQALAGTYIFKASENIQSTAIESSSQTEWTNVGELYECSEWSYDGTSNSQSMTLNQERTCKQDQEKEVVITQCNSFSGECTEVDRSTVGQTIPVTDKQEIARDNRSCKTLLSQDSSLPDGSYTLKSGSAYCNMSTDNGGWTKIASIVRSYDRVRSGDIGINDRSLAYSEFLIIDKGSHSTYLLPFNNNAWDWKGFDIGKMALKIGGQWTNASLPFEQTGCNGANRGLPISNYTIIEQSGLCLGGAVNNTQYCGYKLKARIPAGEKITAFNDVESLSNNCTGDNILNYNFDIYVR